MFFEGTSFSVSVDSVVKKTPALAILAYLRLSTRLNASVSVLVPAAETTVVVFVNSFASEDNAQVSVISVVTR